MRQYAVSACSARRFSSRRVRRPYTLSIDTIIALALAQIRKFEAVIAKLIASDRLWYQLDKTFRTRSRAL